MTPFRFWLLKREYGWHNISDSLAEDGLLRMENGKAIWDANLAFHSLWRQEGLNPGPWPDDAPVPHIVLDEPDFHPDYFECESWRIVSARMAEAMALKSDDADLIPVTLTGNCAKAKAMEYRWLRIRTFTDFLDLERTNCSWEWATSRKTGNRYRDVHVRGHICFLPEAVAPAGLFEDESGASIFATDALALRVIEAGCVGMIFDHPFWKLSARVRIVRGRNGPERHIYNDTFAHYTCTEIGWEDADAGPASLDDYGPERWGEESNGPVQRDY
ncbi:hypothetical protein [Qipengyuania qiaonensis]|uniref:Uncharacterized protein n=1 Tax=Qipengyuania qiaonensis TaxID=2867240 RepID=A0ABS7JA97_9SPHN|nr:hypothetical protein [Qipengyuania qiaonensis]MBX7483873.1 hypothetical protein [Qipengyuania qiaonensis]